jgi:hypothetical protein
MDGRILESMQVSRAVIAKSSSKNQSQLYGPWLESTQKTVDIECEHVRAMELWMRVLHETMTEDMYEVVIEVVWHAIQRSYSPLFFSIASKLFPAARGFRICSFNGQIVQSLNP